MDDPALENRRKEQQLLDDYYHYEVHQTKSNIEIANEEVVGRVLINLYKTIGLPNKLKPSEQYFELLLEIDGKDIYRFTDAYLSKCDDDGDKEDICTPPFTIENGAVFKNQLIKEIWQTMYGEWTLELENGIIVEPRGEIFTQVWVGKKSTYY